MKDSGFETQIEEVDGVKLVHISGPLDSQTHNEFKDVIDPMLRESEVRIVLDCENLTYVNSRGLSLMTHYQRTAAAHLSFFGIAALNQRILKAIDLLGMGKVVRLYATVAEAMEAAAAL